MKRLAALVLAAVWLGPTARAADPAFAPRPLVPTTPQVPAPRMDNAVVPAAAQGERVLVPLRERIAMAIAPSLTTKTSTQAVPAPAMPLPTGYAPAMVGGCPDGACGRAAAGRPCWDRFKAWFCFSPTTGDALPKLRPAPYVGPIAGTWYCNSVGGCAVGNPGCPAGNGCANGGNGRASGGGVIGNGRLLDGSGRSGCGLLGRGCRGECVPPSEAAFPGYKFANPESPSVTGQGASQTPITSTSYKPGDAGPRQAPTTLDPIVRPLSRR